MYSRHPRIAYRTPKRRLPYALEGGAASHVGVGQPGLRLVGKCRRNSNSGPQDRW